MFEELEDEGIQPFEVPNLWLVSVDPDTFVDITDTIETKLEALAQHASQGVEAAEERIRERAATLGERSGQGYSYAEGFKAFRFVDDEG
jgi:LmbE family N-acetylglucosaminyl deacetylase